MLEVFEWQLQPFVSLWNPQQASQSSGTKCAIKCAKPMQRQPWLQTSSFIVVCKRQFNLPHNENEYGFRFWMQWQLWFFAACQNKHANVSSLRTKLHDISLKGALTILESALKLTSGKLRAWRVTELAGTWSLTAAARSTSRHCACRHCTVHVALSAARTELLMASN